MIFDFVDYLPELIGGFEKIIKRLKFCFSYIEEKQI
jgi:hypothetical protein